MVKWILYRRGLGRGISSRKGPLRPGLLNLHFSPVLLLLHHDFLQRKVSAESRLAVGEGCNLILMKRLLQSMLHFLFLLDSLFLLSLTWTGRYKSGILPCSLSAREKSAPSPASPSGFAHTKWLQKPVGGHGELRKLFFFFPPCLPKKPFCFYFLWHFALA